MNIVTKDVVGRCYTKNYATASGVARTGYSFSLFVNAPLCQLFLDTYGWRGTMLLIGAISLNLVVCGYLMVTTPPPRLNSHDYERVGQGEGTPAAQPGTFLPWFATLWRQVFQNFDMGLLASARYWAVAVIYCSSSFAFTMWVVYFVSQAQSNGFSILEATTMVTVAGVANLIAKLVQGFITDRGLMTSWSLIFLCVTFNSVSYSASSWLTSYWGLMTSAVLILFCDGILSCQYDVLIRDTLGVELLAGAFGWIGLMYAVFSLSLGYLPGE